MMIVKAFVALCSAAAAAAITPEDVALHSQSGASALVVHDFLSPEECEALINDAKSTVDGAPLRGAGVDFAPDDPHFLAQGIVDQVAPSVADKLRSVGLEHVATGPVPVRTVWGATLPHADSHPTTHLGGPKGTDVCPKGLCPTLIIYLSDATSPLVMHEGDALPVHYDTPAGTLVIMPAGVIHHQGAESLHARYILGPLSSITVAEQLSSRTRRFLTESCITVEDLDKAGYSQKQLQATMQGQMLGQVEDIDSTGSNTIAISNAWNIIQTCQDGNTKMCDVKNVKTYGEAEASLFAALDKQWCGDSTGVVIRFDSAPCTEKQSCLNRDTMIPNDDGECDSPKSSLKIRDLNDLEKASVRTAYYAFYDNMVKQKVAQNQRLTIECPDLAAEVEKSRIRDAYF